MLVLARKSGESIRIGEQIVITVVEIRSGRARLGIEAPQAVRIRRDVPAESMHDQPALEFCELHVPSCR